MSLTISTDVFCDRCSGWSTGFTVTGPRTNARKARKIAKAHGWHIGRGGMDLCPDCVKVTEWPADMRPEAAG